jgi:hypothetical protein
MEKYKYSSAFTGLSGLPLANRQVSAYREVYEEVSSILLISRRPLSLSIPLKKRKEKASHIIMTYEAGRDGLGG